MRKLFLTILMAGLGLFSTAFSSSRFFLGGDDVLVLNGQTISFRNAEGNYDEAGLKKINRIFGDRWASEEEQLDLRFIEILDYVQDQLKGGTYSLKSGYRSPVSNQALRDQSSAPRAARLL
jgi:uncharacterized protein YcbK (DUF882 family)